MAFMTVLQSLVVSIATWHDNDAPGGKFAKSSSVESTTSVKPCRPSCETIREFLREYKQQKELNERIMDTDDDDDEINREMKDSEAGKTTDIAAAADDDDYDNNMMCEDELKQEPPDHIKLVMEVRILYLMTKVRFFHAHLMVDQMIN